MSFFSSVVKHVSRVTPGGKYISRKLKKVTPGGEYIAKKLGDEKRSKHKGKSEEAPGKKVLHGFLGSLGDKRTRRLTGVSEQKQARSGRLQSKFERKMEGASEAKKERLESKLGKKTATLDKKFSGRAFTKMKRWGMPEAKKKTD